MRKLLMATAAIVGASLSLGMANAAQVYNSDPTKPVTSSVGSGSAGTLALAPGQMTIRIDLRENAYVVGSWGSANSVGWQQALAGLDHRLSASLHGIRRDGHERPEIRLDVGNPR